MCTEFCPWLHVIHAKVQEEVVQERFRKARIHFELCIKFYMVQVHHGRYLLHGHPQSAMSWGEACVQRVFGKGRSGTCDR